jgi:formate hydrogenlyase subunit 4
MKSFICLIIQLTFVPIVSPLVVGTIRKIKARFQNRVGASILQPYRDLLKLFRKNEVVSHDASWIFLSAPFIVFSTTLLIGVSIPILTTTYLGIGFSHVIALIYLMALGTFFLALAGIDTGSSFGGFASSREMVLSALAEGGLMLSIASVAFLARSMNVFEISSAVSALSPMAFAPILLAGIAFVVAMLAETARFPFDNPATHLELTMVHEAMILEYSGKRLALMEWASANKLLIFLILGVNLFFPWGIACSNDWKAMGIAFGSLILKVFVLGASIAILESSIAKFRLFRLPDLLFISYVLSVIAINLMI